MARSDMVEGLLTSGPDPSTTPLRGAVPLPVAAQQGGAE